MRVSRTQRAACPASALALSPLPNLAAGSCEALHGLSLPATTMGKAGKVAAGSFTPAAAPAMKLDVPAFCRAEATATPTPDSRTGLEVWIPAGGAWNGKLLGIGNGGYSRVLDYAAMADGIRRGYATVQQGAAPDRIVATHATSGVVDRSRPLCPYPQTARWNGAGDQNAAEDFTCADDPQAPAYAGGAWLRHVQDGDTQAKVAP